MSGGIPLIYSITNLLLFCNGLVEKEEIIIKEEVEGVGGNDNE